LDVNTTIDFKLGSPVQYTFSTNPLRASGKTLIKKCVTQDQPYSATPGRFNIERTTSTGLTNGNDRYPLYTQTTGQAFDLSLVAYDPTNPNTPLNLSDTTLDLELVRTNIFNNDKNQNFDAICGNPDISIGGDSQFVTLGKTVPSSRVDFTIYEPNTPPAGDHATHYIKNEIATTEAAVRAWYFVKESNNTKILLSHNCSRVIDDETGNTSPTCFKQFYADNYLQPDGIDSAGICAQDCFNTSNYTSEGCYDCLKGHFATAICSRDNFAIKPASLNLIVKDNNDSLNGPNSTQVATNVDGNNTANVAAGYRYPIEITAPILSSASTPSKGYYADFKAVKTDTSIAIGAAETQAHGAVAYFVPALGTCANTNSVAHTISIRNGVEVAQTATLIHQNVGSYKFAIVDHNWTAVDQVASGKKPNFGSGSYVDDCHASNAKPEHDTGLERKVGCYISSMVNGDNSHKEIALSYYPFSFNIQALYIAHANNYTFMQDLNLSANNNDLNMSMRLDGNITAVSRTNTRLTNFIDGCIDKDLRLDINATHNSKGLVPPNITNTKGNPVAYQYYVLNPAAATDKFEGNAQGRLTNKTFNINHFSSPDLNGTARLNIRHNIARAFDAPVNPVQASIRDINVTFPVNLKANQRLDYKARGSLALANANTTFYYATLEFTRGADEQTIKEYSDAFAVSTILKVFDSNATDAGLNTLDIGPRISWYPLNNNPAVNPQFTASKEATAIANNITINNQTPTVANLQPGQNITYRWIGNNDQKAGPARLFINPGDSWFRYNANLSGAFPNGEIFINLWFVGRGEWTGDGKTGNTVNTNVFRSNSSTRRKTW